MIRTAAVLAFLLAIAAPARAAGLDKPALYKHLIKSFSTPPGVEFEVRDLKPSPIEGFQAGMLESRFRGNYQRQPIMVSDDGRWYLLSEAYPLGASKLPGLLSTAENAEAEGPQVHVSKDMKYFIVGEARDLTQDPDKANLAKIKTAGALARGPASAPVTVVEYSDIQCPFCKNAHVAIEAELEKTYGAKVRWVFKHFPLTNIHPWAYPAAIGVACVQKQKPEAAWKVMAGLFEHQEKMDPQGKDLRARVLEEAVKVKLDAKKLETCLDKQESKETVESDMSEAKALKVNSTPTLIVNGRLVNGFRDFTTLKAIIDEMLAEAEKK